MKFSELLALRPALLRQMRLANLAYAHRRLGEFAERFRRAGFTGAAVLEPADPAAERYWPVLNTLEVNPSVVEEHLADEDIVELVEVLGFVTGNTTGEIAFRFEELGPRFLAPVHGELLRAGVDPGEETITEWSDQTSPPRADSV